MNSIIFFIFNNKIETSVSENKIIISIMFQYIQYVF